MPQQQFAASAFGGMQPTSQIHTPKTGATHAGWQQASNYSDRFSPSTLQQSPQQSPASTLVDALQLGYPQYQGAPDVGPDLELGAQYWQQPGWGMDQQEQQPAGPAQISTGITAPYLQAPEMPQTPDMPGWMSGGAARAAQSTLGQALQPEMMALQEQYYPAAAELMNQFQSGQAGAGLGWAGNRLGQQNTLLRAMAGFG